MLNLNELGSNIVSVRNNVVALVVAAEDGAIVSAKRQLNSAAIFGDLAALSFLVLISKWVICGVRRHNDAALGHRRMLAIG